MTREQEEVMDGIKIAEMLALNTEGFVAITGNGHIIAIVEERDTERAEERRMLYGY